MRRWSNVAQESPPQVCSGGLIMCGQAGGSREDLADEPSSPFTRRNVMRTRCRSAFGNQFDGQKDFGSSGHGETVWLEITLVEAHTHNEQRNKRCSGCVTRALTLLSIFSPNNKPLNYEEGDGPPKIMIVCSPCLHVCISCACF